MASPQPSLGARIRTRRRELGLSQTALANRIPGSVDLNYVSRWELGKHTPSEQVLPHLAKALHVDVGYLQEALPVPPSPLSQLDRVERKLELLLDTLNVDWQAEFAREMTPFEVVAGQADTAAQADQPAPDTPGREGAKPARGRTRPRRARTGPA